MSEAAPEPKANMGLPEVRVDARAKVTGQAEYASDIAVPNPAFGMLVTSAIANGTITKLDVEEAEKVEGVISIFTHENKPGKINKVGFFADGGPSSETIVPLEDNRVWHDGQIIALVVAETFEAAREASYLVKATYDAQKPSATFGSEGVKIVAAADVSKEHDDPFVGDAVGALGSADVKLDEKYGTPTQHHNPIELFTTTCVWTGEHLTIYEPSQFVHGLKSGVALQIGISPENVRVISPYVGGAFGSKGSVTPRTAVVALAARALASTCQVGGDA